MTYSHNRASGRHSERFYANGTNPSSPSSSLSSGCHQHQNQQHSNSLMSASQFNTNVLPGGSSNNNTSCLTPSGNGGGGGGFFSNRKTQQHHRTHGGWHRSSAVNFTPSRCAGGNNLLPSSANQGGGNSNTSRSGGTRHSKAGHHNNRTNQGGVHILMGGIGRGLSPTLPTLNHFAGSKCFDAPSPTALPKPPQHWTTSLACTSQASGDLKSAKRNLIDDFNTHNLKLLLNVQS